MSNPITSAAATPPSNSEEQGGWVPRPGSALDFKVGDRVSFYHKLRRASGVVYALAPPRRNLMGIPVAANLSVSVKFGRNTVNVGVDADYCHARLVSRQNTETLPQP